MSGADTRFERALNMVMTHEGRGAAPNDPGGRTDYGISERAHPDVWADGAVTPDEVWSIYHTHYWLPVKGQQFTDRRLALEVFDFAVNAGVKTASRELQRAYNAIFPERTQLVEDGIIGPVTLGAVNALYANLATAMYVYYVAQRVNWYGATKEVRRNGWMHRRGWLARCGCGERWA